MRNSLRRLPFAVKAPTDPFGVLWILRDVVRDQPADVGAFRRDYARATGDARPLRAFAFGDSPALADELGRLVTPGPKRATAALVADYERDRDRPPEPGERSIVLDGRREALCVIETLDMRIGPLGSVDPAFAWDEGEGDRTLEYWLDAHRRFFARRCVDLGLQLDDDLQVVFERFAVVWPEAPAAPPFPGPGGCSVRPLGHDERDWIRHLLTERWGSTVMVGAGTVHEIDRHPGLVAERAGRRIGLATFRPWPGGEAELTIIDALERGRGVGRALLDAFAEVGRREGWTRLWAVTTNDNTGALRFYQRAGWELCALRLGAVDEARRHYKPSIPRLGADGIPIRHELEVERRL